MIEKIKRLFQRKAGLKFAPTDKVQIYHDEMKDLVGFVFEYDIDGIFVSNDSSLHDFLGMRDHFETISEVTKKIEKHYGVDVVKVQDEPIVDIIEFMLKKDNSCFSSTK